MKKTLIVIASVCVLYLTGSLLVSRSGDAGPLSEDASIQYAVKVHEFEGCECASVCPCVFSKDTSFGDCRALMVLTFKDGNYGSTKLKDVSCAVALTSVGKNMESSMGKWKGVLYTPDTATADERVAVKGLVHAMVGKAFAELDERTAPIQIKRDGDMHELTVGKVAHLKIHGIKAKNGEVTRIVDAPSPMAFPTMYCALSDVNTYDDGNSSWSFKGRNGFFADFDLTNVE